MAISSPVIFAPYLQLHAKRFPLTGLVDNGADREKLLPAADTGCVSTGAASLLYANARLHADGWTEENHKTHQRARGRGEGAAGGEGDGGPGTPGDGEPRPRGGSAAGAAAQPRGGWRSGDSTKEHARLVNNLSVLSLSLFPTNPSGIRKVSPRYSTLLFWQYSCTFELKISLEFIVIKHHMNL